MHKSLGFPKGDRTRLRGSRPAATSPLRVEAPPLSCGPTQRRGGACACKSRLSPVCASPLDLGLFGNASSARVKGRSSWSGAGHRPPKRDTLPAHPRQRPAEARGMRLGCEGTPVCGQQCPGGCPLWETHQLLPNRRRHPKWSVRRLTCDWVKLTGCRGPDQALLLGVCEGVSGGAQHLNG